jgi:hypothetical protein
VLVAKLIAVLRLLKVTVLEFRLIVLATLPEELKMAAVILKPAVSNVPDVIVRVLVLIFKSSPNATVIPAAFTVTPLNVLPAVVSVPVPINVIVPVCVYVMPVTKVTLPATLIATVPVSVPVKVLQLIDCAPVFPVEMVTVEAPDAESKKTSSAEVGMA